jgi:hypothetical protein
MHAFLVAAVVLGLGPISVNPFQHHGMVPLESVTWRGGPTGVSTAIAEGDPTRPGPFQAAFVRGATTAPGAQGAPGASVPTCDAAEHRQFDFWLGEWEVTGPNGQPAGRNSITRELSGCVLHERWTGAGGMRGESFNTWDRTRQRWHQTWVSSTGNLLVLQGGLVNGAMQMTGESTSPKGLVRNRITWTPTPDGSVRQFWEISLDGGKTWRVAFDGRYRRAK